MAEPGVGSEPSTLALKLRALQKFHLMSNAGTREGSKNSLGQKGAKTRDVLKAQCSEHSVWERPAFFQYCLHFAANTV